MQQSSAREGVLFVLSGPSGVGKDAVMDRLKKHELPLRFVVTATTRPPRDGEVDGVDYHFVTEEQFQRMIVQDELLEWALVHGRHYGVPVARVWEQLKSGHDLIMRIDVQGAATIRRKVPGSVLIFLTPPSVEALIKRLTCRATETAEELAIRITNAHGEMHKLREFDYVVCNEDDRLEDAVDAVKAIIRAEKCRVSRCQVDP